jgi:parallel beta-helix repeat protein
MSNNNCSHNSNSGISLLYSKNSGIVNNTCSYNTVGIILLDSGNNSIYRNDFINNNYNVYSEESTNMWNSTEKITYNYTDSTYINYLGNYWDDYEEKYPDAEEIDTTGIWGMPYSIDGDKDNYPLTIILSQKECK